jgi:hypothetical protein
MGGLDVLKKWLALDGGAWSWEHLRTGLGAVFGLEGGFASGFVTPAVTVVSLLIIILGLMKVITNIFSARAYLVLPFLVVALALSAWQPGLMYLLFVPLALFTAVGIETLIRKWYDLFPLNPYARLLAVITLSILISGLVWAQLVRFGLSHNYDEAVVYNYNQEYSAVYDAACLSDDSRLLLIAKPDQQELYQVIQHKCPRLVIVAESAEYPREDNLTLVVLGSTGIQIDGIPSKVVTSWHSKDSVLLMMY